MDEAAAETMTADRSVVEMGTGSRNEGILIKQHSVDSRGNRFCASARHKQQKLHRCEGEQHKDRGGAPLFFFEME